VEREAFLARVRHALKREPGQPTEAPPEPIAPLAGWDLSALAESFRRELELVGGHVYEVETIEEARTKLREVLEAAGARSYTRSRDEIVAEVLEGLNVAEAENPADADAGITGARFGIAATGTLVLTSEAGRKSSLLPMHHVALLRPGQLVPTMAEALHGQALPSAWVQATGPSRTADIELTLTTGVHGPGAVHVILIGD
jgi:L-lactate dehydrogenase complex protein LldG